MLLWVLILGISMTLLAYLMPATAEKAVFNGSEYRNEMFQWVKTGIGREGTPSEFIPQHALHLGVFILLSILTMSSLSIFFGSVLLNYMAFYVSQLMLHTNSKFLMFLVGWHFWSLFRIVGFVILGVVLSEFIAHKVFKYNWKLRDIRLYLYISFSLIALDIITKTLFAPAIGRFVKSIM